MAISKAGIFVLTALRGQFGSFFKGEIAKKFPYLPYFGGPLAGIPPKQSTTYPTPAWVVNVIGNVHRYFGGGGPNVSQTQEGQNIFIFIGFILPLKQFSCFSFIENMRQKV